MLSEKAGILKKRIHQTESDINIQYAIIKEQEAAILIRNKHVKEAEDRILKWETTQQKSISKIENEIERKKKFPLSNFID